MSQFNIRSLREIHGDEQGKFINTLAKRVSTFLNKNQTDKLENKEDVYSAGQDVESVVKFHDLVSTKRFQFNTIYYPPTEPDGDKVKLWIKGDNLGNDINDISGFNNHGTIHGDPHLLDGTPFDYGIHTGGVKSVALRFNRPTSESVNEEYITIPDNSGNRPIEGISTGVSIFMRFRIHDLSLQNTWQRTLFMKRDDNTALPNNGIRCTIDTSGRLILRIRKTDGTQYNNQTPTSTIATNTVYEVWFTYAVSGNAVKIYVNNVDQTLTDPGTSSVWSNPISDLNWYVFKKGGTDQMGHVYGDLYDFMVLKDRVVNTAEVGYHYTNKWTTANIPLGQVMVSNYWATYTP